MAVGRFFFFAALTAQNSPKLHFRFINSFVQPSHVESLVFPVLLSKRRRLWTNLFRIWLHSSHHNPCGISCRKSDNISLNCLRKWKKKIEYVVITDAFMKWSIWAVGIEGTGAMIQIHYSQRGGGGRLCPPHYPSPLRPTPNTTKLSFSIKQTCSFPFVRYFGTLFWDDMTIIWDENIFYFFNWEKKTCFGPIRFTWFSSANNRDIIPK